MSKTAKLKLRFTGNSSRQKKRVLFANCIWSFRKLVMIFLNYYEKDLFWLFFYNILLRIIRKVRQITVHFFFSVNVIPHFIHNLSTMARTCKSLTDERCNKIRRAAHISRQSIFLPPLHSRLFPFAFETTHLERLD